MGTSGNVFGNGKLFYNASRCNITVNRFYAGVAQLVEHLFRKYVLAQRPPHLLDGSAQNQYRLIPPKTATFEFELHPSCIKSCIRKALVRIS